MSQRKSNLRVDPNPPAIVRVLRLVNVGAGAGLRLACCSEAIWGCWTHWNPATRRTVQCTTPTQKCSGHAAGMPQRWKGAITVCDPVGKKPFLLDLTPGAGSYLTDQLQGESLRGKLILAQREGNFKRTPLVVTLIGEVEEPQTLPLAQDPMETLMKIWGILDN